MALRGVFLSAKYDSMSAAREVVFASALKAGLGLRAKLQPSILAHFPLNGNMERGEGTRINVVIATGVLGDADARAQDLSL